MSGLRAGRLAAVALVIGAALGMAGTFVPSDATRALLWGIDGIALVVGTTLLGVLRARRGQDLLAAGFLVFAFGETLVVGTSAMDLHSGAPLFAAGAGLWAASLALVSVVRGMPMLVRVTGAVAAVLLAWVAVTIFVGGALSPLSRPLPFFAYPFLAATLVGWAWVHRTE